MSRRSELLHSLRKEMEAHRMKSVQLLICTYQGQLCVKFDSVDNDRKRAKVKALADQYCESLALVRETKTTFIYTI